jgi:membrane protease YdiL (CAAX protease family)
MVIVCGPIVVAGRVRLSTMGLKTATLVRGIVATAVWWSLLQAVAGISSLSTGGGLHITQQWSPAVATLTVGALAAQLLGNALAEETIYRGFFLPRLVTVFVERGFRRPVALGVLLSSIAFALPHVPNRLLKGQTDLAVIVVDQVLLVLAGMMFGWAYWRTRNLFVCVGLHSVINQPSMLIAGPQDWPSTVWPYSTYGALLTYAWLFPSPRTGSLTETAL